MALEVVKGTRVWLKHRPDFREAWLRDLIACDPSILGLGNSLAVRSWERTQATGGRLDLLLENSSRRYVVEIMLGRVDESHIVRCIEYWDEESTRYPRYDHCAVLVAEEMTPRLLKVLSLLARAVPIIALQLIAIQVGDKLTFSFAKVLEATAARGEEEPLPPGRAYWEHKSSPAALRLVDHCLELLREIDADFTLAFHRQYIAAEHPRRMRKFLVFRPIRQTLRVELRPADMRAFRRDYGEQAFEVLDVDKRWRDLRFHLAEGEVQKRRRLLKRLFLAACRQSISRPPQQLTIWGDSGAGPALLNSN